MLKIEKYTVVANIDVDGVSLHKELDFLTEGEADDYIAKNGPEYEKIPVWRDVQDAMPIPLGPLQ